MVQIVLRRPSRMVGVRVVKPEQVGAQIRGATLRLTVVQRPHEEPAARTFVRGVGEREGREDLALTAEQGATALVGIGFDAVPTDGVGHAGVEVQRHQWLFGVRPR